MRKILWIEDNFFSIAGLIVPLRRAGYEVIVADDCERALNELDNHRFDLILLDIILPLGNLPNLDQRFPGLSLLQFIRDKTRINIPVIALTVVEDPDLFKQLKQLNVRKIIVKGPLLPAQLKRIVDVILHEDA